MEERFEFIQEYQQEEESFAELCRRYEISRKTGYKWVERYAAEGLEGLRDRSKAADHHANEILPAVADEVLEMRRRHPHWGRKSYGRDCSQRRRELCGQRLARWSKC
jgi:putative transposase